MSLLCQRVHWLITRRRTHWPNTQCWCEDKSVSQFIDVSFSSLKRFVPMTDSKRRVYLNDSTNVVRQKLKLQSTDKNEIFFAFEVGPPIILTLFDGPWLMHITDNLWESLFIPIFLWSSGGRHTGADFWCITYFFTRVTDNRKCQSLNTSTRLVGVVNTKSDVVSDVLGF